MSLDLCKCSDMLQIQSVRFVGGFSPGVLIGISGRMLTFWAIKCCVRGNYARDTLN